MFKRALICTDFQDGLQRLVHFVPSLVESGLKTLVFFHNVSLTSDREIPKVDEARVLAAQQQLNIAQKAVPEGATVEISVPSGRVTDNLLKAASHHQVDLIFLGMPTRSLLTEKLFGSTTMGLARQTEIPLLILRPQLIATYRESELSLRCRQLFEYLLIPYDGSQSARYLIQQVKQRVEAVPDPALRRCLLCWVIDDSIRKELQGADPVGQAEAALSEVKAELEALKIEVITEVRQGEPQIEILKSAEVNDITAIAVCSSKGGVLVKWSVPSLTNALLRESWHPLLHFPAQRD
jgi:nucleotide-binding universal stress UspA family protein